MKNRLSSVPVIGKFVRILRAIYKAPERFQDLVQQDSEISKRIEQLETVLQRTSQELSERLYQAEEAQNPLFSNFLARLESSDNELIQLNTVLSGHPCIWGDPARLHIDPTAALYSCLFNTNSGSITVGEYTFAGSNVSILAGSHDMHLKGLPRRDSELTEGCDIVIGKGVWLASGCIILGPCEIGDNAVIAAGAVVTQRTIVPPNSVYGGVPAKLLARLDSDENSLRIQEAKRRALDRNCGILFAEGWSEKTPGYFKIPGHWMLNREAIIITISQSWKLHYHLEEATTGEITITGPEGETTMHLQGQDGTVNLSLPCKEGEMQELVIRRTTPEGKLLMAFEHEEE